MENRLVSRLGLAVGLRVNHSSELSLVGQVAKIVEPNGIELPTVIEDDGARNAEAGDDVPPNEPSYFSGGYRCYGLSLYPFGKVVGRHKKVLMLPRSFRGRSF